MRSTILYAVIAALLVFAPANAEVTECSLPNEGWQIASPEDVGLDGELLASSEAAIEEDLPFVTSVLVIRNGCLAYEHYYRGSDEDTASNVFSVTKSVTATLVGIAISDGLIDSVHDSIGKYLDIAPDDPRADITVRHLLWMLSGLGWDEESGTHIGGMLALQRDEIDFILSLPLDHVPGTAWNYSTADSHLLSAVLTAATGVSALEYAQTVLFDPLGITPEKWTPDTNGISLGGTQLFLTPRDMAKFGLLILNGGRWGDQQIVSGDWVDFMTRAQLDDPSEYTRSYAAHWWYTLVEGYAPMFGALGYGGQNILVAPELDLVVVVTANSERGNSYISGTTARRQEEAILGLITAYVLPALLRAAHG